MASPAQTARPTQRNSFADDPQRKPILASATVDAPNPPPDTWRLAASAGVAIALAMPWPALATLGEDSTSTALDSAAMNASLQIAPGVRYDIHELRTPAGTTVREYVLPFGAVFAVAWDGPVMPDLRQILGRHFDRYTAAAASVPPGHRQISVHEPDFVVQSSGQMRAFSGKAYLPQLLPQGVRAEELR